MLTEEQWAFCRREGFHVTWNANQWPVFTAWIAPMRQAGTRYMLMVGMVETKATGSMRPLEHVRVQQHGLGWEVLTLLRGESSAGLWSKQWPGFSGLREALAQARTLVGVRVRRGAFLVPVGGPYEEP